MDLTLRGCAGTVIFEHVELRAQRYVSDVMTSFWIRFVPSKFVVHRRPREIRKIVFKPLPSLLPFHYCIFSVLFVSLVFRISFLASTSSALLSALRKKSSFPASATSHLGLGPSEVKRLPRMLYTLISPRCWGRCLSF